MMALMPPVQSEPEAPRSATVLLTIALTGLTIVGLLSPGGITGHRVVDGSLGIVLGLYTASHPAAFAIDLFFLSRSERDRTPRWPYWLLHGVALLIAWAAVTLGAVHLGGARGRPDGAFTYSRLEVTQAFGPVYTTSNWILSGETNMT
jgi:hypothetical protein